MSNANDMAFPVNSTELTPNNTYQLGLTKREYAAIQIAASMCAGEGETDGYWQDEKLVKRAVARADALLAALAKVPA